MTNLDEIKARRGLLGSTYNCRCYMVPIIDFGWVVWSSEEYNNCITLKRRKEHDTEETIF